VDRCDCGMQEGCAVALPVLCSVVGIALHTGQRYTELSSSFQILLRRDASEFSIIKM